MRKDSNRDINGPFIGKELVMSNPMDIIMFILLGLGALQDAGLLTLLQ